MNIKRREFIAMAGIALAAPAVFTRNSFSQTPLASGKRNRRKLSTLALDDPFFENYGRAITEMHNLPESDPRSWRSQALIHGNFCDHSAEEFFPWHRPYLDYFERICGTLIGDPGFALPYWDWDGNGGLLPAPFYADGPLNVSFWNDRSDYNGMMWGQINTVAARQTTASIGLVSDPRFSDTFTAARLNAILGLNSMEAIVSLVDGLHGNAHVITGGHENIFPGSQLGHMSYGLSSLDPVFWLHHSNVDRIWASIAITNSDQQAHFGDPDKIYSGMFVDENGVAATDRLGDTVDLAEYGYIYDFMNQELLSDPDLMVLNTIEPAQSGLKGLFNNELVKPERISSQVLGDTLSVGAAAKFSVDAKSATEALIKPVARALPKSFGDDRIGVSGGRILAKLTDVQPLQASNGQNLRVYVNCPYLSSTTPSTDQHYAGNISFFGCSPDICASKDFWVDLTEPMVKQLGAGRLNEAAVDVQLISDTTNNDDLGKPVAKVGGIDLFTS